MKTDRLIGILSILLQEEKTTAPELAEKFEVSRRTINRDIEDLCKAGIPIRTAQGTGGGISLMDGYRMDRTILTSKDMQMILAGLRSLDSVSGNRYYGRLMEKWIYVLKHMEALSRMPFTAQKEIFKQLEDYADSHRLTKKEWEAYENSLWVVRDNMACMAAAEREAREKGHAEGHAEGRAEGRAEGMKQGRAEGMKQGRAEGRAEGMKQGRAEEKKAIAKNLLAMGLTIEQVAQGSGLPIEEVKGLQ